MSAMKKKAGIEREKEESETSGDDVRGGRDREKGGEGRKSERKRQRVLEEYRSGGWSRKRKIVKRPGVAGSFRRRYFHGDLRLDGPQTIEERRNMDAPPTGRVEKGRGDRGMD